MTAPIRSYVAIDLETMGDPVIEFCLIRIALGVGFADTFRDNHGITLFVAHIFAIGALHSAGIL